MSWVVSEGGRPPELPGERGLAIDVDRRHPDLAAASKHVRIARPVHDVEDEGVDGVVGMDVEIAEERLPERIVGRTLLRRGVSCARRSGCDGEHQRDGDHRQRDWFHDHLLVTWPKRTTYGGRNAERRSCGSPRIASPTETRVDRSRTWRCMRISLLCGLGH